MSTTLKAIAVVVLAALIAGCQSPSTVRGDGVAMGDQGVALEAWMP
mgnify:CR=1 FL=1